MFRIPGMKIIKPYFGKFQPDLYILVDHHNESAIKVNIENMNKQDILKDFKTISKELPFADILISGTVRFSIRGKFSTANCKEWFAVSEDDEEGEHLLTCVWWKDSQQGIEDFNNSGLYFKRTYSSAKTSGYDYIITKI